MATPNITDNHVALLCGGWSDEREISMQSARAVEVALHDAGFANVDLIDIAQDGLATKLAGGNYDVAFIAMHGPYGEDGCVQGLCEVLDLPYTFSGVCASAISTEKELAKLVYAQAGIPMADGVCLKRGEAYDADELVSRLGLPLFVKPSADGSSFGVTKVKQVSELAAAIDEALSCDEHALVESCIEGTEITVPVIGNDDAHALDVVEVVTGAEFYNLQVKYEDAALHHVIPARLPKDVYARAQQLAVTAHNALGCLGASRSDFIVTADGTPVILETNSIPGMTATSLLPDCARRGGIEFPQLVTMFVEMALEAHPRGQR